MYELYCVFTVNKLTHCGLVMPYGDIDLGQHWLRHWLVAWQHQTITWTSIDISSKVFCGIHSAVLQELLLNLIHDMCSDITLQIINISNRGQWVNAGWCMFYSYDNLIARFMGPTWGPSRADRTQVGPMLAPWTLLSGYLFSKYSWQ